ncbi:MAG TPA: addiction module protein [Nannocystaceae bacterium]|nr:addiction module protein [Nannocystaceae bacterium]
MTSAAQRILEEALQLPAEEREELVGALSSSLEHAELTPEWRAEIVRRLGRIEIR